MRFRLTIALAGLLMAIKPPGAQAQEPNGTDINRAIPIYFDQVIEDIIDRTTRPLQVYSITLARGQQLSVVSTTSPAARHYLHVLAPNTQTVARTDGLVLARDPAIGTCCNGSAALRLTYTVSAAGTYFIWVTADDVSVKYKLQVSAVGTPIAVPNPATAGCLNGRVDSITYSLQLIAAGLPDEVSIGGQKACASCTAKPPRYPEISNRLENALRSRINVEACYDRDGNIFQLKLAQ